MKQTIKKLAGVTVLMLTAICGIRAELPINMRVYKAGSTGTVTISEADKPDLNKQYRAGGWNQEAQKEEVFYSGETPLSMAIKFQNPLVVAALLAAGASINVPDKNGKVPGTIAYEMFFNNQSNTQDKFIVQNTKDTQTAAQIFNLICEQYKKDVPGAGCPLLVGFPPIVAIGSFGTGEWSTTVNAIQKLSAISKVNFTNLDSLKADFKGIEDGSKKQEKYSFHTSGMVTTLLDYAIQAQKPFLVEAYLDKVVVPVLLANPKDVNAGQLASAYNNALGAGDPKGQIILNMLCLARTRVYGEKAACSYENMTEPDKDGNTVLSLAKQLDDKTIYNDLVNKRSKPVISAAVPTPVTGSLTPTPTQTPAPTPTPASEWGTIVPSNQSALPDSKSSTAVTTPCPVGQMRNASGECAIPALITAILNQDEAAVKAELAKLTVAQVDAQVYPVGSQVMVAGKTHPILLDKDPKALADFMVSRFMVSRITEPDAKTKAQNIFDMLKCKKNPTNILCKIASAPVPVAPVAVVLPSVPLKCAAKQGLLASGSCGMCPKGQGITKNGKCGKCKKGINTKTGKCK